MENKIIHCSMENTEDLEEIKCANCGEANYLHENRPITEIVDTETCAVCGEDLHTKKPDMLKNHNIILKNHDPCKHIRSKKPILENEVLVKDLMNNMGRV